MFSWRMNKFLRDSEVAAQGGGISWLLVWILIQLLVHWEVIWWGHDRHEGGVITQGVQVGHLSIGGVMDGGAYHLSVLLGLDYYCTRGRAWWQGGNYGLVVEGNTVPHVERGHRKVEVLQVGLAVDLRLAHREKSRTGLHFWFFPRHGQQQINTSNSYTNIITNSLSSSHPLPGRSHCYHGQGQTEGV